MPEIFDQLEAFESWFDFSALKEKEGHKEILVGERKNHIISSLHAILKPFLLRRVKADVETSLPKKREYILYAPLTGAQKDLYRHILEGDSRAYLEEKVVERLINNSRASTPKSSTLSLSNHRKRKVGSGGAEDTPNKSAKSSRGSTPASSSFTSRRRSNNKKRKDYREKSDGEFFRDLEQRGTTESEEVTVDEEEQEAIERAKTVALASKSTPICSLLSSPTNLEYKKTHTTSSNRKRDLHEKASKPHHATPTSMRLTPQLLLAVVRQRSTRHDTNNVIWKDASTGPTNPGDLLLLTRTQSSHLLSVQDTTGHSRILGGGSARLGCMSDRRECPIVRTTIADPRLQQGSHPSNLPAQHSRRRPGDQSGRGRHGYLV